MLSQMESDISSTYFFSEKHSRSILKAITFRVMVIGSDTVIVSSLVDKGTEVLSVVFLTNFASTILYYLHERLWNSVYWLREKIDEHPSHNKHVYRSLIKSITYRLLILMSDFSLTLFITGSSETALNIILITNFASTLFYFIHEILWSEVHLGKTVKTAVVK
jgi:uncharacterized membrane protein